MSPPDRTVNAATAVDGRRGRWTHHRQQRREELITAAIEAIRSHGTDVSMEAIAATARISKPVLYRYFADKSQLWSAVGRRAAGDVVAAIQPAVAAAREEREIVTTVIDTYLRLIDADPQLYRFVVRGPAAAAEPDVVTDAVDTIAGGLSRVIGDRLRALGLDAGAAQPWAYGLVGFVGAVGDWWLRHAQPVGRTALTEYLVTLLWSGIDGVRASADLPGGLRAAGR